MSYFDDASLVMIPSGYKDQKVYSVKPIDGSGDLTFSRASNATRVNSSGLVEKVRTNLLTYSNDFSNAAWVKTTASVTSGQIGYDGSNNAWKLESTGVGNPQMLQNTSNTEIKTHSIYAKAGNVSILRIYVGSTKEFNLSAGTTSSTNCKITDVGGGWYRCEVVDVFLNFNPFFPATAVGQYIYLQDAQLETGDIATDYIATTSTPVSVGPVSGLPRLDYSGGASCPSLLLEPQRTNLIPFSESFDGATYVRTATTIQKGFLSPDGYLSASKLLEDNTNSIHRIYQTTLVTASPTATMSVYVKYNGRKFVLMRIADSSVGRWYNLETGTLGGTSFGTPSNSTIESVGGGWYRITITHDVSSQARFEMWVSDTESTAAYQGDVTKGVYLYGTQVEVGSYATSYIPTLSSAVTRVAEAAYKTGVPSLIGSAAGTIYLEAAALANDLSERRFAVSNGTTGNVARVGFTNIDNRILAVLYNGSNQCVLSYSGADITQMNKIAFTWAENDFALFVNGVKRSSDTFGSTFAANTLTEIHFNEGDGAGNDMYGQFDKVLLFTSRLSDTELATLTA